MPRLSNMQVLTTAGGLKPLTALLLNFVSGWSVVLGVVIVLAEDVSNLDQGMLLAFGGGVYLQIAATECMSRVHHHASRPKLLAISLLCFALGAIAIGLVLLDHEHCGGDGAAHDH
jgi:zinc transporter ZupT